MVVVIPIFADDVTEPDETFTVSLISTGLPEGTLISPDVATITIIDGK